MTVLRSWNGRPNCGTMADGNIRSLNVCDLFLIVRRYIIDRSHERLIESAVSDK